MLSFNISASQHRAVALLLFTLLTLSCGACGGHKSDRPPLASVKGKITLDGKPIENGSIETSVASGRGALGSIHGGQFGLGTYGNDDGATYGTHKVAVIAREKGEDGPEGKAGKLLVPERYTNPQTSGLLIDVKEGNNSPELKLTSP